MPVSASTWQSHVLLVIAKENTANLNNNGKPGCLAMLTKVH